MNKRIILGQIVSSHIQRGRWAIFELAFRPFFLLGAFFSIISLVLWVGSVIGFVIINPYGGGYWWHIHEMLFGFVAAIIVGFLLTAVQTWTQIPSIKNGALAILVVLWATARVVLLFPSSIPDFLIVLIDLLFLPVACGFLAYPIIKVKMWRNLLFIPLLLAMMSCNAALHYAFLTAQEYEYLGPAADTMIMLVTLIIAVMGGRVFPMFTANGTQTSRVADIPWLEKLSMVLLIAAVLISANTINLSDKVVAGIFIFTGLCHFIRAFRWRIWVTFKTPLVWSLHLSYWGLSLALILKGLAYINTGITHSIATHALTVGGIGTVILSMISRVSLGHTGRVLRVNWLIHGAFILIILAALMRVIGPFIINSYQTTLLLTTLFWVLAYGLFLIVYIPILSRPRVDGIRS